MKFLFLIVIFIVEIIPQQFQWNISSTPVKANLKQIYVVDSANIWIGGDSSYILYSSDKGQNWQIQNFNPNFEINDIFFIDRLRGWAVENGTDGINVLNNIIFTTDGGNNWIRKPFRPDNVTLYTICFTDSSKGFIGGDQNIFHYTTDSGQSWFPVRRDSAIFSLYPVRKIRFINNSYGFACGGYFDFGGVLWHCSDGGMLWSTDSAYADPFFDMEFLDSTSVITIASDIERSYPSAIFKTTNLGFTWQFFEIPYYGVSRGISKRSYNEIWGTFQNEFIYSTDFGNNWVTIPTPNNIWIYDIEFIDSTFGISVADSGYILFYHLLPNQVNSKVQTTKNEIELFQNYPNPVSTGVGNSITKIRWQAPFAGKHTLIIYDILGREIYKLVDEFKVAGEHEIKFDASKLPSGLYIFKLQVDDFVDYKKMILTR